MNNLTTDKNAFAHTNVVQQAAAQKAAAEQQEPVMAVEKQPLDLKQEYEDICTLLDKINALRNLSPNVHLYDTVMMLDAARRELKHLLC